MYILVYSRSLEEKKKKSSFISEKKDDLIAPESDELHERLIEADELFKPGKAFISDIVIIIVLDKVLFFTPALVWVTVMQVSACPLVCVLTSTLATP